MKIIRNIQELHIVYNSSRARGCINNNIEDFINAVINLL